MVKFTCSLLLHVLPWQKENLGRESGCVCNMVSARLVHDNIVYPHRLSIALWHRTGTRGALAQPRDYILVVTAHSPSGLTPRATTHHAVFRKFV